VVGSGAVHVSVLELVCRGLADVEHPAVETQPLPGQRVIAVDHDLAVGDIGHAEDAGRAFVVVDCFLELHPDLDVVGEPVRGFDPNEFRVDRDNAREHLAFGRGVHSCPGGPLARLETRVSIERLLDRTTNIGISEEHHGPPDARRYNYMPTYILRGLTRLHLELTPAPPAL